MRDLLLYGSLGGLTSLLATTVFRRPATAFSMRELAGIVGVLLAGAGIGALYWLTWGLAALVEVRWWQRGLLFAAACWSLVIAPFLIFIAAEQRYPPRRVVLLGLEWAAVCCCAGLASAWRWGLS